MWAMWACRSLACQHGGCVISSPGMNGLRQPVTAADGRSRPVRSGNGGRLKVSIPRIPSVYLARPKCMLPRRMLRGKTL